MILSLIIQMGPIALYQLVPLDDLKNPFDIDFENKERLRDLALLTAYTSATKVDQQAQNQTL